LDQRISFAAPAVIIDECVLHNGVQPAPEIGALFVHFMIADRFDDGILYQVVGVFCIIGKFHGECLQAGAVVANLVTQSHVFHR
jgi:hypothetical protein